MAMAHSSFFLPTNRSSELASVSAASVTSRICDHDAKTDDNPDGSQGTAKAGRNGGSDIGGIHSPDKPRDESGVCASAISIFSFWLNLSKSHLLLSFEKIYHSRVHNKKAPLHETGTDELIP